MAVGAIQPGEVHLRVMSAGRPLLLTETPDGRLLVFTGRHEVLDREAAEVIMALGGGEPVWLRTVEGLEAVYADRGMSPEALAVAGDTLGRKQPERSNLAKTSADPVVLLALAAAGQPNVAANPNCTARTWDLLADHRDPGVQAKAKEEGKILPPGLGNHPDLDVRVRVARNPACSAQLLATFAADRPEVQAEVGANPSTDRSTLAMLAALPDQTVNAAVAANPHTPPAALKRLTKHRTATVRAAAAANLTLPPRATTRLIWDRDGVVRFALAQREDLSPTALSWIERYARRDRLYRQTRWRLAHNAATPPSLHRHLDAIRNAELAAAKAPKGTKPRRPVARPRWIAGTAAVFIGGVVVLFCLVYLLADIRTGPSIGAAVAVLVAGVTAWGVGKAYRWSKRGPSVVGRLSRPPTPGTAAINLFVVVAIAIVLIRTNHVALILPLELGARIAMGIPQRRRQ